jgi:hypothetical protein
MLRLLVLCRHPYHLRWRDADGWLRRELEAVLRRDRLEGATLTRLESPSSHSGRSFDWLVEFRLDRELASRAMGRGGACEELVADMRLLGLTPEVALADDREAVDLRPS